MPRLEEVVFWTGIVLVAVSAGLFMTSTEDVRGVWSGFFGAMGVVLIAASGYRVFSSRKR